MRGPGAPGVQVATLLTTQLRGSPRGAPRSWAHPARAQEEAQLGPEPAGACPQQGHPLHVWPIY